MLRPWLREGLLVRYLRQNVFFTIGLKAYAIYIGAVHLLCAHVGGRQKAYVCIWGWGKDRKCTYANGEGGLDDIIGIQ